MSRSSSSNYWSWTQITSLVLVCVFFVCLQSTNSQTSPDPCVTKSKCGECLRAANCSWCLDEDLSKDLPRCNQRDNLLHICTNIYNPKSEHVVTANNQLTSRPRRNAEPEAAPAAAHGQGINYLADSESTSYTQQSSHSSSSYNYSYSSTRTSYLISPQRMDLRLRVNERYRVSMSYAQPENYPVDLYYLMDLSKSMEDDKKKLSELGVGLHTEMSKITADFQLGFGSFVDKVLMPYVSTVPERLKSPCPNCIAPYGYRNHLTLTTDSSLFSHMVNESAVSGNLDAPEGGFDAIVQAIVCGQKIGWRGASRRLLLFSTDAGFHYAGDGKLGGVIKPNDGQCHLNEHGIYTESSYQDYPSISQINMLAKKHSVNIIFAVTESQQVVYQQLTQHIEGSSCAQLSEDSSNVVELVREEYDKIRSTVEMKDDAASYIRVDYYSKCNGDTMTKTNKCKNLKNGEEVSFEIEMSVIQCPEKRSDWQQVVKIYPVGFDESMEINVTMLCDCDCERGPNVPSDKCKNNGALKCGICECDEKHMGTNCECSVNDMHIDMKQYSQQCRKDNSTTDCSGRGTCVCGVCNCDQRVNYEEVTTGKYCECDNFSCERNNGKLCSGNGKCNCGSCVCDPNFNGTSCECSTSQDKCLSGGVICSGHGECVCGECVCKQTAEGHYSGALCEHCPTCPGRCNDLKNCVLCQMYKKGPLANPEEACATNCTSFTPITVEKPIVNDTKHEHLCTYYDDDDCKFQFVYKEGKFGDRLEVKAQKDLECPQQIHTPAIVFGVIAAIVLIGMAMLLLWKLLTTIHDRREFARFEKERSMAKWDTGENPIYKQATTTFKNPTYAGK